MKKILWLFVCFLSVYSGSDAAYISHNGIADDGIIATSEYDYGDVRVTNRSTLTVDGGGAFGIIAEDHSTLNILSTSLPLSGDIDGGGVWSIAMDDYSTLTFSGGATNAIYMYDDSTALLTGGQINNIICYQTVDEGTHINLECLPGWSWIYEDDVVEGITGTWADGTDFTVSFDNHEAYDLVYENINVIEVAEPISLTLFAFGGIFLKRNYK